MHMPTIYPFDPSTSFCVVVDEFAVCLISSIRAVEYGALNSFRLIDFGTATDTYQWLTIHS